jgi:hypothetical protein
MLHSLTTTSADTERLAELDRILTAAAVSLDLSPSKHEDAISKYTAVGNFLAEEIPSLLRSIRSFMPKGPLP